jgi:hypothetical protein
MVAKMCSVQPPWLQAHVKETVIKDFHSSTFSALFTMKCLNIEIQWPREVQRKVKVMIAGSMPYSKNISV